MRIKYGLLMLLMAGGVVLSGCANRPATIYGVPVISRDTFTRDTEMQLAQSAQDVKNSLQELAQIQHAVYPALELPPPPDAQRIRMGQSATVDWTGPIEPLLQDLAKASKYYRLQVIGRKPAVPVLVAVHYGKDNPATIATILRDAAYQAGSKVDIIVYPSRKIIELRYKSR